MALGLLVPRFLEELVYESAVCCNARKLLERVGCFDSATREAVWRKLQDHPDILFVDAQSAEWANWRFVKCPTNGAFWDDYEHSVGILASLPLRCSVLQLHDKPDITRNAFKLRIACLIAEKRSEGFWQFELCRQLNIEPRGLYQHLKSFFRYDLIVRAALPLPQVMRKEDNVSGSGVLWWKTFFDVRFIPTEKLRIMSTQQSVPVCDKILKLLRRVPNNLLLETDVRSMYLSCFAQQGLPRLFFSLKATARYFSRLRRDLTADGSVIRVRAWCAQTGRFEPSLALRQEGISEATINTSVTPAQMLGLDLQSPSEGEQHADDETDSASANDEEEDGDATMSSGAVFVTQEIPISHQVLCLVKSCGSNGVLSTHISEAVGVPGKRLLRLLNQQQQFGLVKRSAQRIGKHYLYKYFDCRWNPHDATTDIVKNEGKSSLLLGRMTQPVTKQFQTRLNQIKEWVMKLKACALPDFARRFAAAENNNGPDRRTIIRLLREAMTLWPEIKQTELAKGRMNSQPIKIFYYGVPDHEARDIVERNVVERRSEGCRAAVQRNQIVLASLNQEATVAKAESITQLQKSVQKQSENNQLMAQGLVLTDVPVVAQRQAISKSSRGVSYSQRVLARYGFVFPLMIRLKIFHRSCLDFLRSQATTKCNELQLLKNMTVESFLRVVGCGHHSTLLDEYLREDGCKGLGKPAVLQELSPALQDHTFPIQSYVNGELPSHRSPVYVVRRLLEKLSVMGLVRNLGATVRNDIPGGHHDYPLSAEWEFLTTIPFFKFTPPDEIPIQLGVYEICEDFEQFEAYWKAFKSEVDRWIHEHRLATAEETAKERIPIPDNMQLTMAFSKKNWKGQVLLSTRTRLALEQFAVRAFSQTKSQELKILNPSAPEIQELACRLHIPIDAVLRYLLGFLHTADEGFVSNSKVALHLTRGLKYRCHLCGCMYAQRPAIISHYSNVHRQAVPKDTTLFLLPDERKRLEFRARRKEAFPVNRRPRRRNHTAIAGAGNGLNTALETAQGIEAIQPEHMKLIRAVLAACRREDEFVLLGCAVVAERLQRAKCLLLSHEELRNSTEISQQILKSDDTLQCASHPVWETMSALLPKHLSMSSQCLYQMVELILHSAASFRFSRVFHKLRRLPAWDLFDHIQRMEIVTSGTAFRGTHDGLAELAATAGGPAAALRRVMLRGKLKTVLLTPVLNYRPSWSLQAVLPLTEAEVKDILTLWRSRGWVVQTKSTSTDRRTELLWRVETVMGRRCVISHQARLALFGKIKDYVASASVGEAVSKLEERLALSEPWSCLSELNGCDVAALCNAMVSRSIDLEPQWTNDPEFYRQVDVERDNELERILIGDVSSGDCDRIPSNYSSDGEGVDAVGYAALLSMMDDHEEGDRNRGEFESSLFRLNERKGLPFELTAGSETRVLSRAIDGGVERHVMELTPEVPDLQPCAVMPTAELKAPLSVWKRRNKFIPLIDADFMRDAVSYLTDIDPPECLLFEGGYFRAWKLTRKQSVKQESLGLLPGLPWSARCNARPAFHFVPVYEDDFSSGWSWDVIVPNSRGLKRAKVDDILEEPPHEEEVIRPSDLLVPLSADERLHVELLKCQEREAVECQSEAHAAGALLSRIDFSLDVWPLPLNVLATRLLGVTARLRDVPRQEELRNILTNEANSLFSIVSLLKAMLDERDVTEFELPDDLKQSDWRKIKAFDALLFALVCLNSRGEIGMYEEEVKDAVEKGWRNGYLLSCPTGEIPPSGMGCKIQECMELLRIAVRIPCLDHWRIISSKYAEVYCIPRRIVWGHGLVDAQTRPDVRDDSEDDTGIHPIKFTSKAAAIANQKYSGCDLVPLKGYSADRFLVPDCVPLTLWQRYGSPNELSAARVLARNNDSWIQTLDDRCVVALLARATAVLFLSTAMQARIDALHWTLQPTAAWITLDGSINEAFIGALCARLVYLVSELPGSSINTLARHVPLLDLCEIEWVLQLLILEGVLQYDDGLLFAS